MSLIEITTEHRNGYSKIFASSERFTQNFMNNKIALKYYINANWLVKHAIRTELVRIVWKMDTFTEEQTEFLKTHCDFVKCVRCKTYKTKNTHCKKCKVIKNAILIETICVNEVCSICLDTLNNCVSTICNHKFHKLCIINSLIQHNECPLCRTNIGH